MPIGQDRNPAIQVGNIAAIGDDIRPSPAVGDMMDAFRSGFLTVEDVQHRFKADQLESDALKTQLQAGDIRRRLAPGEAQTALDAQGLTAEQIQAARKILPGTVEATLAQQQDAVKARALQEDLTSGDPNRVDSAATHLAEQSYTEATGHAPPDKFDIAIPKEDQEPLPKFDEWLQREYAKDVEKEADAQFDPKEAKKNATDRINAFQSSYPLNSLEDRQARAAYADEQMKAIAAGEARRAEFVQQRMSDLAGSSPVHSEWQNFQKTQNRINSTNTFVKGTAEYQAELLRQTKLLHTNAAVEAAKLKAVPEVIVARVKAEGESASKEELAKSKAMTDVFADRDKSEAIKRFEPQFEAFAKLDALRASGRTPTNSDDITLLYSFVKLLDPSSAVREGEVSLAKSTNPAVQNAINQFNALTVTKDKILGTRARADLNATMDNLREGAINAVIPEMKRIQGVAKEKGVPIHLVFNGPQLALLVNHGGTKPLATPGGATRPDVIPSEGPHKGKTLKWVGPGPNNYVVSE